MPNPWNGKAVLEVFWWNCWNANYPFDWYTYIAKLAPRIAALGFDGIWTPPPCKDTSARNNMGYTPYDYYDLGQKNRNGAVGTRFGTQDAFLRMIAVAHANGLEVYPDIVLDHCSGGGLDASAPWPGTWTDFQPNGFAGAGMGRWPRNWLDFHMNPAHWNGTGAWVVAADGPDFCYQGRCSDSGSADQNCAARANARAWFVWFTLQTGVDGFRFDDVMGYPPEVVGDLLWNAMGPNPEYFCVGEFVSGNSADLDTWAEGTSGRSGTFDYPFRFALGDLASSNGFYNVGNLPSLQQQDRLKTVPFVNNHDTYDGQVSTYLDPDNPRTQLAYAVAITVDGSPQFFYADLFENISPWNVGASADAIPARPWMENLVWCHQKLAFKSGDYFVRYQDSQQLLILERGGRAIVAINNDGANWHNAWISTAFAPNTKLHDYSGSCPLDLWTNQDGWVQISTPPASYSVWGPAGVTGGFSPTPRRTAQQFEMADDLGDSDTAPSPAGDIAPGYGGYAVAGAWRTAGAVWPAFGSQVNVSVYADAPQEVDLMVQPPAGGAAIPVASGAATPTGPLGLSFTVSSEGSHLLTARLSETGSTPARLYVKVDYIGPAASALF